MKTPLQEKYLEAVKRIRMEYPHKITYQGKLLKWKVEQEDVPTPELPKRGAILEFTRSSRLRLLKLAATVKWQECSPCLFITLTYPDESDVRENYMITYQRSYFWREIERYLKRRACGIWRVEWKQRKSGLNKGVAMPHIHVLVIREKYIPMDLVNETWKRILKVPYVITDIQAAENERHCGAYIAKYCAKPADCYLVNAAYLNIAPVGRAWGVFRKQLLPTYVKQECKLRDSLQLRVIYEGGIAGRKERNVYDNSSYTLLGDMAGIVGQLVFGPDVDEFGEIV